MESYMMPTELQRKGSSRQWKEQTLQVLAVCKQQNQNKHGYILFGNFTKWTNRTRSDAEKLTVLAMFFSHIYCIH